MHFLPQVRMTHAAGLNALLRDPVSEVRIAAVAALQRHTPADTHEGADSLVSASPSLASPSLTVRPGRGPRRSNSWLEPSAPPSWRSPSGFSPRGAGASGTQAAAAQGGPERLEKSAPPSHGSASPATDRVELGLKHQKQKG